MRSSSRIFLLTAVIEVLLVAGAAYMLMQVTSGAWKTFDEADAVTRIVTVMGAAIGGVGGAMLFLGTFLRWRGHLDSLLPRRQRLQHGHYKAVPYPDVPAVYGRLGDFDGPSSLALAFVIATAARTGEARSATWAEVDFFKKVWTAPATRMKSAKEHRVPLSQAALDVLSRAKAQQLESAPAGFIFPAGKQAPLYPSSRLRC